MPLQSSGAISLNQIHVEAGGSSGTTASINDSDIRGLINKASGATMSFSEWYGASAGFAFTTSSPVSWPSGFMDITTDSRSTGLIAWAQAKVTLTFSSTGITGYWRDIHINSNGGLSSGSGNLSATSVSYTNISDVSSVQARWVISNCRITFSGGDSNERLDAWVNGNQANIRTGNQGNNTSLSYTGSWYTITPHPLGGSGTTRDFILETEAYNSSSSTDSTHFSANSGGYVELQIRVNKTSGGSETMSYRATSPDLDSYSNYVSSGGGGGGGGGYDSDE